MPGCMGIKVDFLTNVEDSLSLLKNPKKWNAFSYLIFVIFFYTAKFLEHKIYTEKRQFFALNL